MVIANVLPFTMDVGMLSQGINIEVNIYYMLSHNTPTHIS